MRPLLNLLFISGGLVIGIGVRRLETISGWTHPSWQGLCVLLALAIPIAAALTAVILKKNRTD